MIKFVLFYLQNVANVTEQNFNQGCHGANLSYHSTGDIVCHTFIKRIHKKKRN